MHDIPQNVLKYKMGEVVVKSPFELLVLITQFSISITHNSKIVGPLVKSLFDKQ